MSINTTNPVKFLSSLVSLYILRVHTLDEPNKNTAPVSQTRQIYNDFTANSFWLISCMLMSFAEKCGGYIILYNPSDRTFHLISIFCFWDKTKVLSYYKKHNLVSKHFYALNSKEKIGHKLFVGVKI